MELKRRKLHTSGGFSFAELMLTMLILALMTGMLATGIPVVINTYQTAVNTANAETYLNTTMIVLRSRLCVALEAESTVDKKAVTYIDPKTNRRCQIFLNDEKDKQISIQEGITKEGVKIENAPEPNPLISSGDDRFVSSYDTIAYTPTAHGGLFTIEGLKVEKVNRNGDKVELATLETPYFIHTLNP